MTAQYWKFVEVATNGKCRIREIETARNFLLEQFPELANLSEISKDKEREIQSYLIERWRIYSHAELCLRCFISHKIREHCLYLEKQFGVKHGFTHNDLFPILLDDTITTNQTSSYQSLATEILATFKLDGGGSLSTWISWIVKCHQPLKDFLLQHGIYLATDWGILNRATPNELEFLGLTLKQLQQDKLLLENYHAVYRQDRLQTRVRGKCQPPTLGQLKRIANLSPNTQNLSPENILKKLQNLAQGLREYRIAIKGGVPPVVNIENPEINQTIEQIPDPNSEQNEQQIFLKDYTRIVKDCLDRSVEQVIDNRVIKFQKKKPPKHQDFIIALTLFYQGIDMGEIAFKIGYKAQYQVSRLLKLEEFQEDVGQQILVYLKPQVKELAKYYTSSERLQNLEQQLNEILNEEVDKIIQTAKTESGGRKTKSRQFNSLFADAVRKCIRLLAEVRE
ncbi:MAG: hypothetical protein F6K40_02890 [Okeania sp. SIO3I5]|uniref:hypothetical protein n=1 Tax=Okeania sp. SIO3I5 TaxID=2607805 RepID=UPI0013BB76F7|nr:hypothetical protein [Okeania sp. SIO3I5]NEQ35308.1 hypothetical protein [Okeania sp. SIO3I5]